MKDQFYDGLYHVSMDHSPSEQLDSSEIYTTALVLSPGLEHHYMAKKIAYQLRSKNPTMSKWSRTTKHYKKNFISTLIDELAHYPTYVFAISARKNAILQNMGHFIRELGIESLFIEKSEEKRIRFGPFYKNGSPKKLYLTLSKNRWTMAIYIAHFVLRMHHNMWEASLRGEFRGMNWNFLADKLPGPPKSDMELLFNILLTKAQPKGQLTWGHYVESDKVESDLLADNIAGCLTDMALHKQNLVCTNGGQGFFYWEKWDTPDTKEAILKG